MPKMQFTMTFRPDAVSYIPRDFDNSSYSASTFPSCVVYSQKNTHCEKVPCRLNGISQFPLQSTILSTSIIIQLSPSSFSHLKTNIPPKHPPPPHFNRTNHPLVPISGQKLHSNSSAKNIIRQPILGFFRVRLSFIPEMSSLRSIYPRQSYM